MYKFLLILTTLRYMYGKYRTHQSVFASPASLPTRLTESFITKGFAVYKYLRQEKPSDVALKLPLVILPTDEDVI